MNHTVRHYLIELARKRVDQTVTYQKLSDDCGLGLDMRNSPQDRKILGRILGEISIFEHEQNRRPLLSAGNQGRRQLRGGWLLQAGRRPWLWQLEELEAGWCF